MSSGQVIRLAPFHYCHINDHNDLCTRLVVGPGVITLKEHEKLSEAPTPMIVIPPEHYCKIRNPIVMGEDKRAQTDSHGNFVLRYGESEFRFHGPPFPLFPGEELIQKVTALTVVPPDCALKIRCLEDFTDKDGVKRIAGDEWLFRGPATYYPIPQVAASSGFIESIIVQPDTAVRLRARRNGVFNGVERVAGEVWLHTTPGAYLLDVDEIFEESIRAEIITPQSALHLRSILTHVDRFGVERKAGQEWLVTFDMGNTYIPEVSETKLGNRPITVLTDMQYCVILDPIDEETGVPRFGEQLLKRGPDQFFLRPGERLQGNQVRNVEVLEEGEALLLLATDFVTDGSETRRPGATWMIKGPEEYVPPVGVSIIEKRGSYALSENEGLYVRDRDTGSVRAVYGPQSYLLEPNEELWSKSLPTVVEDLLQKYSGKPRDPTRLVTLRSAHNTAVQVNNFLAGTSRVVFGPALIALGPDEEFTMLSLSGGKPKRPHMIKDIALQLGPDFMTDHVIVETADHAKLELRLSYNWEFAHRGMTSSDAGVLFSVPDFVGDGCQSLASRVRAAVAATPFDEFHRTSATIIREAVFGSEAQLLFPANSLLITGVDIKAVEPVDQKTREMLQQSVQLAIDITTQSVQRDAQHKAQREEQAAKGELGNLKIQDQTALEEHKLSLITLRGECLKAQRIGQAVAEAAAKSEAELITAEAAVEAAKLRAQAAEHRYNATLGALKEKNEAEIAFTKAQNELQLAKSKALAEIEAVKFSAIVKAIGPDTLADIARAGPEMQAKLLEGLGIQSFLITDGNSPINLFSTAQGLVSGAASSSGSS